MSKYFAVFWKNKQLSIEELKVIWDNIEVFDDIVIFDTKYHNLLPKLWWFPKIWKIITNDYLEKLDLKLIWTNKQLSTEEKRKYWIKRFKVFPIDKADFEVKTKWVEVLFFGNFIGQVQIYQNIQLYETIDYKKPISSMKIGMMPAKLTHILLNLSTKLEDWLTIYDPFCWLGTSLMLWNYLDYNCIWSDINPTPCKQNIKRWKTTNFYKEKKLYIFKQDATKTIKNPIVKSNNIAIISEWYLWPIVQHKLNQKQAENLEKQVGNVYIYAIKNFLSINSIKNI